MIRVYLARQPILDKEGRIFAYELLFRSGFKSRADVKDGRLATAKVIESLVNSFGLKNIIRDKKGFINIDEETNILKIVEILPAERIGFEILETSVFNRSFFKTLEKLKSLGYSLSMDDFVFTEKIIPFMDLVDFVKIDILMYPHREDLEKTLEFVRKFPVKLIAEKVESYEVFKACLAMDFDYFQGFFFQKPELVTSKTIEPDYAALIKLYNLISREADIAEVERVFKKFSDLALKLLQLINSAYYSLRQPVRSIRHAVLMLGYRNLLRWILILMYSLGEENISDNALFEEASIRGFFMERLSLIHTPDKETAEKAFITGMVSLVDILLGVPIECVLEELSLEEDIKRAVLKKEGFLGDLLSIVEGIQRERFEAVDPLMDKYGFSLEEVLKAQTEALKAYSELEI